MADITVADVQTIIDAHERIESFMRHAVTLHASRILPELAAFDARRHENPARWARLVVAKAILSSGADLTPNILLALGLSHALENGATIRGYDDCEDIRASVKYGARSVGNNINRAVLAYNDMLTREVPMTWDTLNYAGLANKTRSWSLALYDSRSRVYTLDTHMCRGLARLAGLERTNITKSAYPLLASFMISMHERLYPEFGPLVSQWAMWNEFRHAGTHAEHILLAS